MHIYTTSTAGRRDIGYGPDQEHLDIASDGEKKTQYSGLPRSPDIRTTSCDGIKIRQNGTDIGSAREDRWIGNETDKMLMRIQDHVRWATPRPHEEMREKPRLRSSLFSTRGVGKRPKSVHTEFMETDWEMEESDPESEVSEIEDDVECGLELEDGENSPRISVGSVRLLHFLPVIYTAYSLLSYSLASPVLQRFHPMMRFRRQGRCGLGGHFRSTTANPSRLRDLGGPISSTTQSHPRSQ